MLLWAGFTMTVHLVELTVVRRINPYAIHGYQYLFKPGPAAAHTDLGIARKTGTKQAAQFQALGAATSLSTLMNRTFGTGGWPCRGQA